MKFDSATAFGKHLRGGFPDHFSSVYLVICSEAFDRKRVFGGIVTAIKKKGAETSVLSLSAEEGNSAKALNELASPSLFREEQIVILDAIDKGKKEELAALASFVKRPPEGVTLILGAALVRPLKELLTSGKKEMVILDLSKEKPWEKKDRKMQWLSAVARRENKILRPDALSFLFTEVGEDFASLEQEVIKLITFVGTRSEITEADAQGICAGGAKQQIWKIAEQLVWDKSTEVLNAVENATDLFILITQVRSQLQTGLKLSECLERGEDLKTALPRAFPKTLEKYCRLITSLPKAYFKEGLITLFECELMAKNSGHPPAFLWGQLCLKLLTNHSLPSSQPALR